MDQENSILEKISAWIRNSVMLKLFIITILMLLLLIPTTMIKSVITERENLNQEVISEVSSKWSGSQTINGPILTIPVVYETELDDKQILETRFYHLLPENLDIKGTIVPEKLRRSIYEVIVYKSDLAIIGNFKVNPDIELTNLKEIKYDQAFLTIGIADLRGIEEQVFVKWGNDRIQVKPGSRIPENIRSGVTVYLPLIERGTTFDFEFTLKLEGSQNLSFIPIGDVTSVELKSNWNSPSFNGNFLPDQRTLTPEGFSADWKILQLNRNFPQSWMSGNHGQAMENASFGVELISPLDDYQKGMRSAKYAAMTIALTFLIFFLVEVLNKRKIHPFQYTLVGLSLCLFYILLVSISEHTTFNVAYLISTLGILAMICLYSLSVFKVYKLTLMLGAALASIYGFLFITLQMEDYALLLGSIGLALILALTMYFTRNINWYKLSIISE